jgi:replicative superfamily II helicase
MGDILDNATLEEVIQAELLTASEAVDEDQPRDFRLPVTRSYQQEMFEESLKRNLIIALETGAGKTHVALLRLKHQMEQEKEKVIFRFCHLVLSRTRSK